MGYRTFMFRWLSVYDLILALPLCCVNALLTKINNFYNLYILGRRPIEALWMVLLVLNFEEGQAVGFARRACFFAIFSAPSAFYIFYGKFIPASL